MSTLADAALEATVVVSTVPIEAQPDVLALPWRSGQTVLDVLYANWPTPLARRVTEVGGIVAGGLDVLFWQATQQVELMTGSRPRSVRCGPRSTPPWVRADPWIHAGAGLRC